MIRDAWIVARQEWRNITRSLVPSVSTALTLGLIVILFGILAPFGLAGGWLTAMGYLFLWFWLVWLIVAGPISDTFAGERERHTLEALFASRLPDAAILAGKIGAIAVYAWLLTSAAILASVAIAVLSVSVPSTSTFATSVLLLVAVLTPLAALLAVTAGAVVSITAASARQAHQIIIAVVPVMAVAGWALTRALRLFMPSTSETLGGDLLTATASSKLWMPLAAGMALAAAILYAVAAYRLHRQRVVPA